MIDRTDFELRRAAHHRVVDAVETHGWQDQHAAYDADPPDPAGYRASLAGALLRAARWLAPPASARDNPSLVHPPGITSVVTRRH